MKSTIWGSSGRAATALKVSVSVALAAGFTMVALPASAAPEPAPRALVNIEDVPPATGNIYDGTVNDPSVQPTGAGVTLTVGGLAGFWTGAYASPKGVPSQWASSLWWCLSAGPFQANNFSKVEEINAPTLAYILSKYQSVNTNESRAAISALVHTKYDTGHQGGAKATVRANWASAIAGQSPAANALLGQYWAEGEKFAGPYNTNGFGIKEVQKDGNPVLTADGKRQYEVSGIGVKSAKGNFVAGHKITVNLSGPLQWAEGGTAAEFTSTESGQAKIAVGTGNGVGTAALKVAKTLPGTSVAMGTQTKYQTMVSIPEGNFVEASGSANVDVISKFQPVATSKVVAKVVPDGKVGDTLEVKAAAGQIWLKDDAGKFIPVTFTGTAYSTGTVPATVSKAVPAGAKVLGTQKIVADKGPGTYGPVYLDKKVDPQMVTWVWEVTEAAQTKAALNYLTTGWKDSYGLADETSSVPTKINIDSNLRVEETKSGSYLVDDQWSTGFQADHSKFAATAGFKADLKTVDNNLYFIAGKELPKATSCTPDKLIATETTVSTNGFKTISPTHFKVDPKLGEGTYVVVHSFAGDDRVLPYTSPCDDVLQQFKFREPEREIKVTTQIQPSNKQPVAGDGGNLKDTHLITGEIQPGDKGTSNLYYIPVGGEMKCTPENLVWKTEVLDYANAVKQPDGSYTITSTGYSYGDKAGTYTFVEEAFNAEGQPIARGVCGNPTETIVVKPAPAPAIAITGTNALITAGVALALLGGGTALVLVRRKRTN